MSASVLIWAQHLLGSGHVQRAAAIASALAERGAGVRLVLGGPPVAVKPPPGVVVARLPSLQAGPAGFTDLRDASGAAAGEASWSARRTRLLDLVAEEPPDVVVTEMYPFGRRAFADEVAALFAAAPHARKVVSLRDVLVTKEPAKRQAMLEAARGFDRVLVHGDPAFLPLDATFPGADALGERLIYTGFVLAERKSPRAADPAARDEVLVSAGGGAVGAALLRAACTARPMSLANGRRWRLITGTAADPADVALLWQRANDGIVIETHRDDFRDLLASCAVSVSQAGYNTVAEALYARARLVLVPFARAGEDEQTRRARRLAELGRAVMLDERDLAPLALARAVDRALDLPRPDGSGFAMDGAARTAAAILDLA